VATVSARAIPKLRGVTAGDDRAISCVLRRARYDPAVEIPLARFLRWLDARKDIPRECGNHPGHAGPTCNTVVTMRSSRAAGHPGFCSHDHDGRAQVEQPF